MAEATTAKQGGDSGPRSRSRERYEGRRAEIIDIAARVFAEQGYDATTIDDLVAATGLQRGGLYHYISGKEELLIRIHERFLHPLLDQARVINEQEMPPDEALRALAHALMDNIARYTDQVTVFFHEWRTIHGSPRWESLRRERREFEDIIGRALERGRREGIFRFRDRRIAQLGFLGMINYTPQWYAPQGRASAWQIAEDFCDIFLDGIRVPPAG